MIKLGICTGIENAAVMKEIGYDYVELGMSQVAQLGEAEYAELLRKVKYAPLPVEAMNGMIPGEYKLCSPEGTGEAVRAYLRRAFGRAQELGVRAVVFGSGGARRLPEGMRYADGYRYLEEYLRLAGGMAAEHGLFIAIEPLRAAECNIINHVAEAQYLAGRVGLKNVGALADLYHMMAGGEDCAALEKPVLHCHIAERVSRAYPKAGDGTQKEYAEFFGKLKAQGYCGRVSVEGGCADFAADARAAFAELDGYRK